MKLYKIMRPNIEVEFVGIIGFFAALSAIFKVGIRRKTFDYRVNFCSGYAGTVKKHTYYVIPKYKLKRVKELTEESEVDTE